MLLAKLAGMLEADLALWSWGRGFSVDGGIQPMAMVDHGMTDSHKAVLADLALDRRNDTEFRARIIPLMNADRQVTVIRKDLYSDAVWKRRPFFRKVCDGLGMDSWVMAVTYPLPDTWANLTFWAAKGQKELGERERVLVDIAICSISWLHPTAAEAIPPDVFVGLTPRQRGVLTLLLDGMSRKAVAKHLKLTEHTVGDHIKSIYSHFGVHALSELIARLLRSS
ncbi:regulatory protein, luxR family [Planctomicrobium piriforme]|uniref:Regulatory protein, luxR family n=2 Tax=Planctomicrobium piriforme TaxID=1576369 RepID=A0A1I3B4U0_9PLAN|nr:regulatory protein, luxR family [Planctomicrobium piriforme]